MTSSRPAVTTLGTSAARPIGPSAVLFFSFFSAVGTRQSVERAA
ncbi:MAG TPA: hypothetical protein VGQ62_00565 [Chloroflexota bacterium]|nr:hypothetical protein [Chloroflexota bacterium]